MRSLLVLFALNTFISYGQIEEIRRITEQLCSPEFHGRGYYKKGDSLAADYLVEEFKKLNVEGYKGEYLQPFNINGVNTFPGKMKIEQNGIALKPGVHFVVDPSSAGTNREIKPKIVDEQVLMSRSKLTKAIEEVKDWDSDYNALGIDIRSASGDTLSQLRGVAQVLADIVPVVEIVDSKFTWSVGRTQFEFPLIQIQDSVYKRGALHAEIEAKEIQSYASQNVIAYIPSKKKCAKTIMFTAHYDHLGRMGDSTYFPGANDNASGTAMLLTMAKYFKEHPSKYNIMFVAFAGEEAGLLGSKHFVENPILKLKKIRFLMNLDIMGSGEDGITAVNATLFDNEFKLLQDINNERGLLKVVKSRGPAANSDHYWFTEKGVPAFFIYTMGPNKNYHDVFDLYENLSFEEYEDITSLLIEFVERL
jgi:hypothetical protein